MSNQSFSLKGPAVGPIAKWVKSQHSCPSKHSKGSVNCGGGGCGKGSGCGKKSPCGGGKKKSKCCGGGGGGCGGSKKKSCGATKYKVVFKDINGKMIDSIQLVEKQSAAQAPWTSQSELEDPSSKYKKYNLLPKYSFSEWSNYDWMNVENDIEVSAVYRNMDSGQSTSTDNELIENKISRENADKIQNFSDEYLNQQAGVNQQRRLELSKKSNGYITRVTEYGKYNKAINACIDGVNYVTHKIDYAMDVLFPVSEECLDWDTFNDLKKCLLNIQTTFVYQTRMSINLDLQDVYTKLMFDVDDLMETCRNGEEIDDKIKEYRQDLDLDLEFFEADNKDRINEFINSYNDYAVTINKCFPTPPLEKIKNI